VRDAKLIVTVADPSKAIVPGATVRVVGLDDATKKISIPPAKTDDKGVASFDALLPGRYAITGEFPGFDLGLLTDVRLKSGENKHLVLLPLKKIEGEVTVTADKQAAASTRATAMGNALTRDQLDALSDDPTEMQRQLQEIAGSDLVIRVDSFEGQQLPPKAMIKSIHITRDTFAAESHYAGFGFIDIITQPGVGPLRGGTNYNLRDGAFNGSNPFTPVQGPDRSQNFGANIGGSVIKDKATFSLSANGNTAFTTPIIHAATVDGTQSEALLSIHQPNRNAGMFGLFDYAVTRDQTIRMGFNASSSTASNQGIGNQDLPERAYSTSSQFGSFRIQEAGPLGRRFFTNTRLNLSWSDNTASSNTEAETISVLGAFNSGGAQRRGGTRSKTFNFASDLDYVRGINSWRAGVQMDGTLYHSDSQSNYLGAYTFTSLAAYQAGLPATFTRTVGTPVVDYFNLNSGIYLQDDLRLRKNLTISPGVRYELQTHVHDDSGISPRIGATWSPFKSGKTSLQASWGIFHDWLSTGTYQQSLQLDGTHELSLNIANPSYPDPGAAGTLSPTDKYLIDPNLQLVRTNRLSAGFNQTITPQFRVTVNYGYTRSSHVLRGLNENAPVNGVRPNPAFVNVIEATDDASALAHTLSTNVFFSFAAPSPALNKNRWNWRRGSINVNDFWGWQRNNTDGAFSVPATGSLAAEWGPSANDIRNRASIGINSQALKNLNTNVNISAVTGQPYNETTGLDNNGDLLYTDRPAGVGRNSLRAPGYWIMSGNFSYGFTFGKPAGGAGGGGGGVVVMGGPGGQMSVMTVDQARAMNGVQSVPGRYRLSFNASIQNLTNHTIYSGYSGNELSPFFMKAQSAPNIRRVFLSTSFGF
jgi:hypothetical protein